MLGMDLGVLKDMPGIRDRASAKLAQKQVAILTAESAASFKLWFSFSSCLPWPGAMSSDASISLQGDGNT
jgi:hypothetical protein